MTPHQEIFEENPIDKQPRTSYADSSIVSDASDGGLGQRIF